MALVNKSFSSLITFTRASTATFVGSNGLIQSAAIDAPRFDYNPATLAARGLLIEESRTNVQTYSQDFLNATYGLGTLAGTITLNQAVAPDGTATAAKYIEDTSTAGRYLTTSSRTATANTYVTTSLFVKIASGARYFGILYPVGNGWTGGFQPFAVFDVINGTVTAINAPAGNETATIVAAGNGWYRCSFTAQASATPAAGRIQLRITNSSATAATSYLGDGTSGFFWWGLQIEEGSTTAGFPTSYIPTVATSLTRSQDVARINTLSPWFNATEGGLYAQATVPSVVLANRSIVTIGRSTSTALDILIFISRSADSRRICAVNDGTSQFSYGPIGNVTSTKGAVAYKLNDSQGAFEGTASPVDTACTIPTALTTLYIGNDDGVAGHLNGHIQNIVYYPRRLSQAELEALTA